MVRKYQRGPKQRPDKPDNPCAAGCKRLESSGWAGGVCAACRRRPPLQPITNLATELAALPDGAALQGILFAADYGAPLLQQQDAPTTVVPGAAACELTREPEEQRELPEAAGSSERGRKRQLGDERAFSAKLLHTLVALTGCDGSAAAVAELAELTGCSEVELEQRLRELVGAKDTAPSTPTHTPRAPAGV